MRNVNYYRYAKDNHVNNRFGNSQGIVKKNYNPFDPLMDLNILFYKWNNIGKKECNCRDMK